MEMLEGILTRRSVRKYTGEPVSDEELRAILTAGMSGPSAVNARPWSFLVIRDKETLERTVEAAGRATTPLKDADVGILVCGDMEKAFSRAPDFWVIDGSISCQNMLLAAHGLGLGGVWLGVWPVEEKITGVRELFDLPDPIVPHSLLAIGRPAEQPAPREGLYEEERIHWEKW